MKLDPTSKRLLICIPVLAAAAVVTGAFFAQNLWAFAGGVAIGAACSAVRVLILAKVAARVLELDPKDADNRMKLNNLARYVLTAAALALSLLLGNEGLYGAAVGILTMPAAGFIVGKLLGASKADIDGRETAKRTDAPPEEA